MRVISSMILMFIAFVVYSNSTPIIPEKVKLVPAVVETPEEIEERLAAAEQAREDAFLNAIKFNTPVHLIMRCQYNPGSCDFIQFKNTVYIYSDFVVQNIHLPRKYIMDGITFYVNTRCAQPNRDKSNKMKVCKGG